MSKVRNTTIDIMKGITILLVILGHFDSIPDIKHWILSFHMPLFFIIAGYFHKPQFNYNTFKKDINRLVIPYVFTMGILLVYSFSINILYRYTPDVFLLTLGGAIFPNETNFANSVPVWFLLALFWCRQFFNLFHCIKISSYNWIIAASVGILCIYTKQALPFEFPFSITEGVCALPFFVIGYIYNKYDKNVCGAKFWSIIFIILWIAFYRYCSVSMIDASYNIFPLALVCACGGTIGVYYLSDMIKRLPYISCYLEWAGVNSLVILCVHTIERYVAIPYDRLIEMTNVWVVWGMKIVICSVFTIICYKFAITRYVFNLKKT